MAWAATRPGCIAVLDNETYVVCNGLWKVKADGHVRLGDGSWAKATAMCAMNGHLWIVEDDDGLYKVDKQGGWQRAGEGSWAGVKAMTAGADRLWIVQGSELYKVKEDGTWEDVS